jgi:2-polyprenyl-3-methyl-5-hydroxy-6-metoxy-1,4-benzoquinol methylase
MVSQQEINLKLIPPHFKYGLNILIMTDNKTNWHKIWNSRFTVKPGGSLQQLIDLDGFDSPLGAMTEESWREYVAIFINRCLSSKDDSIFEIGCGSGAFLFPLYQQGYTVGGIDYSAELLYIAKSFMPIFKESFQLLDASKLEIYPKNDIVIANHVIHYFDSLDYTEKVLSNMLLKASKTVFVSGVPDISLRNESEKMRRGTLSLNEYEVKYAGLKILYFERHFFEVIAKKHNFSINFLPHEMPGFAQNLFRYDIIFNKN